jgi:hypothetical protein
VDLVGSVQGFVLLILGIGSVLLTGFAAVDSLRHRSDLFPAVGRLSKPAWVGILVAAFLISLFYFASPGTLGLLNVIGVIAAGVYLADIRPKIKQISGGGRNTGGSYGPYGPY